MLSKNFGKLLKNDLGSSIQTISSTSYGRRDMVDKVTGGDSEANETLLLVVKLIHEITLTRFFF
jgi:hypothetical protein